MRDADSVRAADSADSAEFPFSRSWKLPEAVQLALLLEASAPKAGNVHPTASFNDMNFAHFAASAVVVGNCFEHLRNDHHPAVGQLILNTVRAVQQAVSRNTILGSLLLFGPIAGSLSGAGECSRASLRSVLSGLTAEDCQAVYEAIRVAQPGGIGRRETDDVAGQPPQDLVQAMSQVADFDAVARQYTNGFEDIFERTLPWLDEALSSAADVSDAICRLQLRWLAHEPDGLIVRKQGIEVARQIQQTAAKAWYTCASHRERLTDLDDYRCFDGRLRSDGNRFNPGTTADLIAATLLVKLLNP